ncbi:hypothetical protein Taro_036224 [Colocasia esculenta]|uniref:Uncharacterized protein n=1 Tax=Colocasia esculenta TaxID=4460 RepID=A0A843W106_COLES|nr:hypothetical protein [Colocasia esculenta]
MASPRLGTDCPRDVPSNTRPHVGRGLRRLTSARLPGVTATETDRTCPGQLQQQPRKLRPYKMDECFPTDPASFVSVLSLFTEWAPVRASSPLFPPRPAASPADPAPPGSPSEESGITLIVDLPPPLCGRRAFCERPSSFFWSPVDPCSLHLFLSPEGLEGRLFRFSFIVQVRVTHARLGGLGVCVRDGGVGRFLAAPLWLVLFRVRAILLSSVASDRCILWLDVDFLGGNRMRYEISREIFLWQK